MGSTRRREARRRAMSKSVQVVTTNAAIDSWPMGVLFMNDDDAFESDRFETVLPSDLWRDMGRPAVITVTVEPGDLLNGEPQPPQGE
jgi:hypothetical protein